MHPEGQARRRERARETTRRSMRLHHLCHCPGFPMWPSCLMQMQLAQRVALGWTQRRQRMQVRGSAATTASSARREQG